MNGATGQSGEEAVDHRRDASKDLEKRFRDCTKSGMRVFGEINGRHQTDRNGNEHGDKADKGCPGENRIAPNEPSEATWSSRNAICGLHSKPNKNWKGDTFSKNRKDSNKSERTIPIVVRMAMVEAMTQKDHADAFDQVPRAEVGAYKLQSKVMPKIARQSANTNLAAALVCNSVL